MKKTFAAWMLALAGLFGITKTSYGAEKPRPVISPIDKVFIPIGFDDNDDAEVIVHGYFPNNCYKVGPTTTTINHETKTIQIRALAYYYEDVRCIEMSAPFIQSIKLGILNVGDYKISVVRRPDAEVRKLPIARAKTDAADDYLYAPVSDVRLTKADGKQRLTVEGTYPLMFIGCMVTQSVKTYRSPGNVLVVQPLAEVRYGKDCNDVPLRFSVTADVSEELAEGQHLVHVRVLAGNSLNKLIDISQ